MGRAGEPVSVLNYCGAGRRARLCIKFRCLAADQRNSNWVVALFSRSSLGIALLPTAFGKSTADFASGIQISPRDSGLVWVPTCISSNWKLLYLLWNKQGKPMIGHWCCASAIAPSDFVKLLRLRSWEENAVCPANETLSTALDLPSGSHLNQPLGGRNASPRYQKIYVFTSENPAPK